MGVVGQSRSLVESIQNKVGKVLEKIRNSNNEDAKDLLNQIMGIDNEDEEGKNGSHQPASSFNINRSQVPDGSHHNISHKINEIIHHASTKSKAGSHIKLKNRRSKDAIGFSKTWISYVQEISTSRYVRVLNNKEQNEVAEFVFKILTKPIDTPADSLNLYSIKKFITNSIEFACDCDKETWTV